MDLVYNAYVQSAGEINNNLANFRNDIDNIKSVNVQIHAKNKQLLQGAYTKTDLDALRGVGDEIGVRALKDYGGKALNYLDNKFLGGKISNDTENFMNKIGGLTDGNKGGEMIEENGVEMTDALDNVDRVDESEIGDMSFEDFMNQFQTPRTAEGNIDFDRSAEQINTSLQETKSELTQSEGKSMEEPNNETGIEESKQSTADATAEEVGTEGAETGIDEGIGAGLETAGTALDATGIGAVVGVPLQVAGAVLEGGALYEASKSVVDWVEQLFGKKPNAPSVKNVPLPKPPPTLAQRGLMITPTMDTLDTQPSFSGGW